MQGQDVDRYPEMGGGWNVYCAHCNKQFHAKRSDASYCSANCRVSAAREAQKFEQELVWIAAIGRKVLSLSIRYRKSKKLYEVVKALHDVIGKALSSFENE